MLETVDHFLEEGVTFQEFGEDLWETMHGVGREILKVVLDTKDQEIREDRRRKRASRWCARTKGPSSPPLGM
jgi:hypothetical protein